MRSTRRFLPVVAALAAIPATADATYSIVGTDQSTRQVGGAGTSCVGTLDVRIIIGTAPNIGAVHAQAQINTAGRDEAVSLLMQGSSPDEIIAAITAPGFDPQASARQYGVVDLMGRAAGWTGSTNGVYANDSQGNDGDYTYSVQGNILTGQAVIDQTEDGFVNRGGCDLPDKLMLALEAGAENDQGDTRCTGQGIPSDSAFIQVVDETGAEVINISVTNTRPESPLISLRAMYDAWRASNPCADDGGSGTDTGGGSDTGGDGGGGTSTGDGGGDDGGGGDGGTGSGGDDGGDGTGGATGPGDGGGGGPGSDGDEDGGKSCGCATSSTGELALGLLLVPLLRRRRPGLRARGR